MAFEPESPTWSTRALKAGASRRAGLALDQGPLSIRPICSIPRICPGCAEVLDEAFERLGPDIVLAHAKELSARGQAGGLARARACSTGTIIWPGCGESVTRVP